MKYRSMLLASAVLQAGVAQGMGLGNIEVQSYLGSPLKAQAHLISPGEFGEREIRANIARVDVYDRFGARFEALHSNLDFRVVENAAGELALSITSPERIREPFLDIVVELSWPQGTTYRRYNLLIDPPEYAARWRKQPVKAQPVEIAAQKLISEPEKNAPLAVSTLPDIELGGEYRVQAGDSLWKIAKRTRKAAGLSIQQAMDVIYQNNPSAFVNGEKDKLMLGASLSVPSQSQMLAQTDRSEPTPRLDQLDNQTYSQTETRLQLASEASVDPAPQSFVATTPDTEIVPAQVVSTEVQSDLSSNNEMERLKQQLAQLQKERAELVAFQNAVKNEIADFRGQQAELQQAMTIEQQAVEAPSPIAQGEVIRSSEPEFSPMVVASGTEQHKQELEQEPTQAQATFSDIAFEKPTTGDDAASFMGNGSVVAGAGQDFISNRDISSNDLISKSGGGLWYLLAMVPLGLLIVLLGVRSHRVQEIRRSEEIKDEDLYDLVFGAKRDRSQSDSPEQIEKAIHQIRDKAVHFEEQHHSALEEEHLASKDDVSQMIELYMLYSQYQKALNVILTEISKRPTRKDLRIYLMQVYAHMQDWDSFEDQMEVLERMGDAQLLEKAKSIRLSLQPKEEHRNAS